MIMFNDKDVENLMDMCLRLCTEVNELNETINWLNCKLEDTIKEPFSEVKMTMINMIKSGRFIAAIKEYRDFYFSFHRMHCPIAEAKRYADSLRDDIYYGKYGYFDKMLFKRNYGLFSQ